jgi:hypothetical protein
MKKKLNITLLASVFTLIVFSTLFSYNNAEAASFENRERDIGISAGMWLEGDVYVGGIVDDYVTKDSGFLLRAFYDAYIAPKFAAGFYFNYSSVTIEGYDGSITEFGGAFKYRFLASPTVAIKPGLNFGYRKLDADESTMDADAMGVNLSVEIQIQLQGNMIFFIEPGFLAQPVGGNEDADITFAPIMYINAGICF